MKIKKIILKDFKRFDNLTINLGDNPKKIVALIGPNGCGKSSVFDAFEEKMRDYKGTQKIPQFTFFLKSFFDINTTSQNTYNKSNSIQIWKDDDTQNFDKKSFHVRTSYRFTPSLNITNVTSAPDIIDDQDIPGSSVDLDQRLTQNYRRLLAQNWSDFWGSGKTGDQVRNEMTSKINLILNAVLDIEISNIGNPLDNKGQLYFKKNKSKDFPYENLSSGEKEVVDIIIDFYIKINDFNDTVFCIDEPELHLNTGIQRKLLIEIEKIIPDSCQLWVATHSIGFLRALQKDLKEKSQVLDFSEKDYFEGEKEIVPMKTTRNNWQRVFQTALEDLTGLLAPKTIIYCEGKPNPSDSGDEQGLDAIVYNSIFEQEYEDSLFISSGGDDVANNLSLAIKILNKAFKDVDIFSLKDRDSRGTKSRAKYLAKDSSRRMLIRREIENYLFDKEILKKYCDNKSISFNDSLYDQEVTNIKKQDLKPLHQKIKQYCQFTGSTYDFKITLSNFITPDTNIYSKLQKCIFY